MREALEEPLAYESAGIEDALVLLVERSQARAVPPTRVILPDRQLLLGVPGDTGRPRPSWSPTRPPWFGSARAATPTRPGSPCAAPTPTATGCSASPGPTG